MQRNAQQKGRLLQLVEILKHDEDPWNFDMMRFNHGCGVGAYEFFVESDTEGEPDEVFEPEYRVSSCSLRVYARGDIQFVFAFKHCSSEGWADVLPEEYAQVAGL